MNDPLPPQEESVAARRARVLARMAASRSALRAEATQKCTLKFHHRRHQEPLSSIRVPTRLL
jgi:hypothetical protein